MVRALTAGVVMTAATLAANWSAPAQALTTAALVERAGRYVERFEQTFPAILSAEHQVQKVIRANGAVRQVRDLRSDFLLVKTDTGIQAFRDVIQVDRKAVGARADRLRRLFLDSPRTAAEQASAITKDSERHYIGPSELRTGLSRSGHSPLLPLAVLKPGVSSGFRFTSKGGTLTFQEVRTPSMLAQRSGSARINLMSKGTVTVDPESGRVLAAEFTAQGPPPMSAVSLTVRYRLDRNLDALVPIDVRERHWRTDKPADDRLEVHSTYTNFRRFDAPIKSPSVPSLR